jgi:hypothetical protein
MNPGTSHRQDQEPRTVHMGHQVGSRNRVLCFSVWIAAGVGGGGWTPPSCLLNPPNKMPWDTPGGQFQPPPTVVNDAELPVCNDSDNE